MKLNIKTTCDKRIITRDDGEVIRDIIFKAWKKEDKIVLDFKHIQIASVSFIDEAFGMLANYFSRQEMKGKLEFVNMDVYDKQLLNDILISRFKQKTVEDPADSRDDNQQMAHAL